MEQRLRALIVEDSERDAELVVLALRRGNYDVSHARVQTADAMRVALEQDWDVVLSDYSMPGFSAMAALGVLRESGCDIPFIIISGTIGEETAVEALKAGAHDFLVKDRLARLLPAIDRELREARIRRERRDTTALLDSLYETAPIGLAFLDRDFRYLRINETLAAMNGVPAASHIGRNIRELLPELAPTMESRFREILETGQPMLNLEVSGETPAAPGVQRHWLVNYYPVRDGDGALLGLGSIVVEITSRKTAEAERERLLAQLAQAVRVRDEFLSIASHELRTPITPLQLQLATAIDLVRTSRRTGADPPLEKLESKLSSATRQAERLTLLVNNLLDVTRITSGRLTLSPREVDLRELVQDVVDGAREAIKASGSDVTVLAEKPVRGTWDPVALESAVSNLLMNALKYGEGKPIEIATVLDRAVARISVRDHGIGIALEEQERIFERFERAVPGEHYGGFGIGLWVARHVVESHGGSIRVVSNKGAGSTFTVECPLVMEVAGT